ncbi:Uncharacterized protein TCM_004294 [Theobroma cacao]|uniref:Uncharacterized protein n=1 Tax=Theobroma cacao TaxID=3641 RepID=A0A061DQM2_THECC|nr:Uncharacterized protein TCM_004294 [Theobroma cacao]
MSRSTKAPSSFLHLVLALRLNFHLGSECPIYLTWISGKALFMESNHLLFEIRNIAVNQLTNNQFFTVQTTISA